MNGFALAKYSFRALSRYIQNWYAPPDRVEIVRAIFIVFGDATTSDVIDCTDELRGVCDGSRCVITRTQLSELTGRSPLPSGRLYVRYTVGNDDRMYLAYWEVADVEEKSEEKLEDDLGISVPPPCDCPGGYVVGAPSLFVRSAELFACGGSVRRDITEAVRELAGANGRFGGRYYGKESDTSGGVDVTVALTADARDPMLMRATLLSCPDVHVMIIDSVGKAHFLGYGARMTLTNAFARKDMEKDEELI